VLLVAKTANLIMAGFWPPIVGNPTTPLVALTKIHTSSLYPFSLLPKVV
jgi:hypothetical protein